MTGFARKAKVFAYITSGRRILLFAHADYPEAGIQVPAGTMRHGETVEQAAMREAAEETGLTDLVFVRILGTQSFDMRPFGRNEIHDRTFTHIHCRESTPDAWENWENDPDGSPGARYRFELFWASRDEPLPTLVTGHDAFIKEL